MQILRLPILQRVLTSLVVVGMLTLALPVQRAYAEVPGVDSLLLQEARAQAYAAGVGEVFISTFVDFVVEAVPTADREVLRHAASVLAGESPGSFDSPPPPNRPTIAQAVTAASTPGANSQAGLSAITSNGEHRLSPVYESSRLDQLQTGETLLSTCCPRGP